MKYFDTHCHLNHNSFQEDLDQVLLKAAGSGVEDILVPGWDLESSKRAVNLAEKHSQIVAAVGIHPSEYQTDNGSVLDEILKLAKHPRVVAIGEIGLDYYHDNKHNTEQQDLLRKMLEIAKETEKKVILHSRSSMQDIKVLMINWMRELRNINHSLATSPGIFHSFEGNLLDAQELLEYGFTFGIGGPLTYKNSGQKFEVFSSLPEKAICLETDSPYLPPSPHRGERNEPAYLPLIGSKLAQIRNQKEVGFLNRLYKNSYKMLIEDIIH